MYDAIREIRERVKRNKKLRENYIQNMAYQPRMSLQKQKRSLTNFNRHMDLQAASMAVACKKVNRNIGESIVFKNEDYRKRQEVTQALELAKPDVEKYGSHLWMSLLRNQRVDFSNKKRKRPTHKRFKSEGQSRIKGYFLGTVSHSITGRFIKEYDQRDVQIVKNKCVGDLYYKALEEEEKINPGFVSEKMQKIRS